MPTTTTTATTTTAMPTTTTTTTIAAATRTTKMWTLYDYDNRLNYVDYDNTYTSRGKEGNNENYHR